MSKKIRIAVTGAGGGVGQSVIKSLYDTDYEIVALDGEELGTGLYAAPRAYRIPYAKSPEFIDRIMDICRNEECKLLFPGLDAELKPFSENRERFAAIGTTVVVSDPAVVEISDNKLVTYDQLIPYGISVPVTLNLARFISQPVAVSFPLIIKQQVGGARSKNVFLLKKQAELDDFLQRTDIRFADYVLQEYIEGDEYTCGTINLDGRCEGVIVMRRILRDGDTYKCFSVKNEVIENEVRKVMDAIKPFGACNVQLRLRDGKPYIFEINARCSGTTASRTLCGFNEPKMIADYLLQGIKPVYDIKELTILRYWKELVVENERVDEMKRNNNLNSGSFIRL